MGEETDSIYVLLPPKIDSDKFVDESSMPDMPGVSEFRGTESCRHEGCAIFHSCITIIGGLHCESEILEHIGCVF